MVFLREFDFNYHEKKICVLLSVHLMATVAHSQGIPKEVIYEPDEGGYPSGYTPTQKLGKFDLSSSASNEPFRHLFKLLRLKKSFGMMLPIFEIMDLKLFLVVLLKVNRKKIDTPTSMKGLSGMRLRLMENRFPKTLFTTLTLIGCFRHKGSALSVLMPLFFL